MSVFVLYCYVCVLHSKIIHLKRFQFFNGRWVKSQQVVTFPLRDLNAMRYTVQSNGDEEEEEEEEEEAEEREVHSSAQSTPNRTAAVADASCSVAEVEVHEQSPAACSSPSETTETLTIPNGDAPAVSLSDHPPENDTSAGDVGSTREGVSDSAESHEVRPSVEEAPEDDDRPPVSSRAKQRKIYDLFAITV